jgi:hypothetical protein
MTRSEPFPEYGVCVCYAHELCAVCDLYAFARFADLVTAAHKIANESLRLPIPPRIPHKFQVDCARCCVVLCCVDARVLRCDDDDDDDDNDDDDATGVDDAVLGRRS